MARVWIAHRTSSFTRAFGELFENEPSVPYFLILIADASGIEVATATQRLTHLPWPRILSIDLDETYTTRRVPCLRLDVRNAAGRSASFEFMLARPKWELFPELDMNRVDKVRDDLERQVPESTG